MTVMVLPLLSALQWPVDIAYMKESFLDEKSGERQAGLSFESYDAMRPYDYGETVFRYIPDVYGGLPGSEDALLVLEHENGFQSIYTGITPEEVRADRSRISAGEYLKAPAGGEALHSCTFYIRDAHLNQLVNPLLLLPVPRDTVKPLIESVILRDESGRYELIGPEEPVVVPVGNYQVFIRAVDETSQGIRQMPYSFALYNLGSLLMERQLDAVILKDNVRSFKDGASLNSIFPEKETLHLGEIILTSGRSLLEVSVFDVQGNEGTRSIELQVER